jgi:hypothetical protein
LSYLYVAIAIGQKYKTIATAYCRKREIYIIKLPNDNHFDGKHGHVVGIGVGGCAQQENRIFFL